MFRDILKDEPDSDDESWRNTFEPRALASIKQHMVNYTQNDPARTEKEVLELKVSGKVVNFWPEGSEEEASYWVPDAILVTYGTFIRKEFLFRPEY